MKIHVSLGLFLSEKDYAVFFPEPHILGDYLTELAKAGIIESIHDCFWIQ